MKSPALGKVQPLCGRDLSEVKRIKDLIVVPLTAGPDLDLEITNPGEEAVRMQHLSVVGVAGGKVVTQTRADMAWDKWSVSAGTTMIIRNLWVSLLDCRAELRALIRVDPLPEWFVLVSFGQGDYEVSEPFRLTPRASWPLHHTRHYRAGDSDEA